MDVLLDRAGTKKPEKNKTMVAAYEQDNAMPYLRFALSTGM